MKMKHVLVDGFIATSKYLWHDWFIFLLVNGNAGAMNPCVSAQLTQPYIRRPTICQQEYQSTSNFRTSRSKNTEKYISHDNGLCRIALHFEQGQYKISEQYYNSLKYDDWAEDTSSIIDLFIYDT